MQYVNIWDWPFTLSKMLWKRIHVGACVNGSFPFVHEYCPTVWRGHNDFFQMILGLAEDWEGKNQRERRRSWWKGGKSSVVYPLRLNMAAQDTEDKILPKKNYKWGLEGGLPVLERYQGVLINLNKSSQRKAKVVKVWIMQTRLLEAHKLTFSSFLPPVSARVPRTRLPEPPGWLPCSQWVWL